MADMFKLLHAVAGLGKVGEPQANEAGRALCKGISSRRQTLLRQTG